MVRMERIWRHNEQEEFIISPKRKRKEKKTRLLESNGSRIAKVPRIADSLAEGIKTQFGLPKNESMGLLADEFPEIISFDRKRIPKSKEEIINITFKKRSGGNYKVASLDNIFTVVTVFAIAILFITGIVLWNNIAGDDLDTAIWSQSSVGGEIKGNAQSAYDNFDGVFVLLFFSLHLGVIILAFALRTHPIIYVAGILIIAILAILSAPLSNAWEDSTNTTAFSTASNSLPMTDYIMSNLPFVEVIFGFITLVVLAGLARSEGIV